MKLWFSQLILSSNTMACTVSLNKAPMYYPINFMEEVFTVQARVLKFIGYFI